MPSIKTLALGTSLVRSRLDNCNSLDHAPFATLIKRLQRIQNDLACALIRTSKHSRINRALTTLHRLQVEQRIQFKIISISLNLLHKSEPRQRWYGNG